MGSLPPYIGGFFSAYDSTLYQWVNVLKEYNMPHANLLAEENLNYIRYVKDGHELTWKELSKLSGYSEEYVRAWFARPGSSKYRPVPDRAVTIVKLKITHENPAA
jgi:hypothetical protein